MKIGILYICTGKYDRFFEDFYKSCEKNFLPDDEKTYYVWTDSKNEVFNKEDVVKFYQKKLGWPYDTMMRFKMFGDQEKHLEKEDFLYFFNANMIVNKKIGSEVIPYFENEFCATIHPGFYKEENPDRFPYERNEKSVFYIKPGDGEKYFQGCFYGGQVKPFLKMSTFLSKLIYQDLNNEIIPVWHDESAINWFFNHNPPVNLDSGFAYPENWDIPFEKKIIQLDKSNYGGHSFLRQ